MSTISAVRVQTVDNYITGDPAFAPKLGPRDTLVVRRDGERLMFPKEVVEIATRLVAAGQDPVHAGKAAILNEAASYFGLTAMAPIKVQKLAATPEGGTVAVSEMKPLVNWTLSIWSLLVSAYELSTCDTSPGHEARAKKLSDLSKEYQEAL